MSEESSSASVDSPANAAVMSRLLELENRTGYRMQQFNGQRKYWDPNWTGETPPRGCEIFVGKIPRDLFEDELVPAFEKIGRLYELRLMMDFSGYNRGYAFVTFTNKDHAAQAISMLDNYEIRPDGQEVQVSIAKPNATNSGLRQPTNTLATNLNQMKSVSMSMPGINQQRTMMMANSNRPNNSMFQSNFPQSNIFQSQNMSGMFADSNNPMFQSKPTPPMYPPPFNQAAMFPPPNMPPNFNPLKAMPPLIQPANQWKCALDQNIEKRIKPAVTLNDLAKIKCPVTLLSELHSRLNNGPPPSYRLYKDPQTDYIGGICKYIYRVNYMGTIFTPPTASDSIEEAKKIAAKYVISEIEPWLKAQLGSSLFSNRPQPRTQQQQQASQENNPFDSFPTNPRPPQFPCGPSGDMLSRDIENCDPLNGLGSGGDLTSQFNQYMKILNDKKPMMLPTSMPSPTQTNTMSSQIVVPIQNNHSQFTSQSLENDDSM